MCLETMPSWCRQVNWGNCGVPWVNCAVLCVKDDWKGQFWGLRYCLSKLRSLLIFFRQVWRHTVRSPSLTESVWGPLDLRPYPSPQTPDLCALQTDLYPAFIFFKGNFPLRDEQYTGLIWHSASDISVNNFQPWTTVWRYDIFRKYS